ncbi:hypothetical protein PAEPH01_0007 [Pancytospora epiphaga]|nr:hypothetical protein PAEPH01_0007 [Pancytospora epiphaga]
MVVPDALSRLGETDDKEKKKSVFNEKKLRGGNIKKNRWNKHVVETDERSFWIYSDGLNVEILEETEREAIVIAVQEELEHRASETVYYKVK